MAKLFSPPVRKLGFGLMRLPVREDNAIDLEHLTRMVDAFIDAGFTYFDTAYVYHGQTSESAACEALTKRYPRDAYQLATKLPAWELKKPEDCERVFQESLRRAGVDFFDVYLLHSVHKGDIEQYDKFGGWEFLQRIRADGRAKRVGFSFHDDAAFLDEILTRHPFVDVVQLQINYADWESDDVQARLCYETCVRHGKAVIVMEPVKGGMLAAFSPKIQAAFDARALGETPAALALRFAAALPEAEVVLSGMSNFDQMQENIDTFSSDAPFSPEERAAVDEVNRLSKEINLVPCTACGYCVKGCPQKIQIPNLIAALNNSRVYGLTVGVRRGYDWPAKNGAPASACVACGACEGVCPQHLGIIDILKEASALFD